MNVSISRFGVKLNSPKKVSKTANNDEKEDKTDEKEEITP